MYSKLLVFYLVGLKFVSLHSDPHWNMKNHYFQNKPAGTDFEIRKANIKFVIHDPSDTDDRLGRECSQRYRKILYSWTLFFFNYMKLSAAIAKNKEWEHLWMMSRWKINEFNWRVCKQSLTNIKKRYIKIDDKHRNNLIYWRKKWDAFWILSLLM